VRRNNGGTGRAGDPRASDRLLGAKRRDALRRVAELAEDRIGMLTERRHRVHPRRRLLP
jgi:hypothetical protein